MASDGYGVRDEKEKDEEDSGMVEDEEEKEKEQSSLMQLLYWRYLLTLPPNLVTPAEKEDFKQKVLALVTINKMASLYRPLCAQLRWPVDESLAQKLNSECEAERKRLEAKIEESKATAGDMEVHEATFARAEFLARSGEKDLAYAAYKDALALSVGIGSRMDVVFCSLRVALLHADHANVKHYLDQAKSFIETGADWERRNLLKIYEAVYMILVRDFKKAALLFLDSIATFTCYELFPYNTFIFYTVVTSLISVDRVQLKEKVVNSPEILSVYRDVPNLELFLQSLYKSKYADFFRALTAISPQLRRDPFLSRHFTYMVRELRVVAYKQFLQSYRSVKLDSMATAFGLSPDELDAELSRFISANRLNCKIDKVNGIVETNRPDAKNHQYQQIVKQGDILLNRVQKLTKSVSG